MMNSDILVFEPTGIQLISKQEMNESFLLREKMMYFIMKGLLDENEGLIDEDSFDELEDELEEALFRLDNGQLPDCSEEMINIKMSIEDVFFRNNSQQVCIADIEIEISDESLKGYIDEYLNYDFWSREFVNSIPSPISVKINDAFGEKISALIINNLQSKNIQVSLKQEVEEVEVKASYKGNTIINQPLSLEETIEKRISVDYDLLDGIELFFEQPIVKSVHAFFPIFNAGDEINLVLKLVDVGLCMEAIHLASDMKYSIIVNG